MTFVDCDNYFSPLAGQRVDIEEIRAEATCAGSVSLVVGCSSWWAPPRCAVLCRCPESGLSPSLRCATRGDRRGTDAMCGQDNSISSHVRPGRTTRGEISRVENLT